MSIELTPLWLSFKLASVTTFVLILIGIPLAYGLAYWKSGIKFLFEAILSLPLVLPPSVLGFYLLIAFAPDSYIGSLVGSLFDYQLVFTFGGMVVASVIYSLPFMVQPVQTALENLPESLREAAYTLGKTQIQTVFYVLLPNIKTALLSGIVLSFAHTVGEFGVILMIGGNIPGETRVASLAVFDAVESLNYEEAHFYSLILLLSSLVIITFVYAVNKKKKYG